MAAETEIKFHVRDIAALERKLSEAGFKLETPSTHEVNTLYDLPSGEMRRKGEVLRIRRYGERWTITHKTKGTEGRHKVRAEHETRLENGEQMAAILRGLGYAPSFVYEKYRGEWSDGQGHVVIDRTPIGDLAEIEGAASWIDQIAGMLGLDERDYITKSYAVLFMEWKAKTGSQAANMTYEECNKAGESSKT